MILVCIHFKKIFYSIAEQAWEILHVSKKNAVSNTQNNPLGDGHNMYPYSVSQTYLSITF